MKLDYKVKIGLAPVRRDCTPRPGQFNWEFAEERGRKIVSYIEENYTDKHVSFADTKELNDVQTIVNEKDALRLAEIFRAQKVDAILVINTNFGNEEAIAILAKEMNVPLLLWAPLDDHYEADGTRLTDSQCGLFGTSRLLGRYHIPFSFIPSCHVHEQEFKEGLEQFVRVTCMVKNFRKLRVGQFGLRPKAFTSVIYNEDDLIEQFGIHAIPVNMAVIQDLFNKILETRDEELEEGAKLLASRYVMDEPTAPLLKKIYAFVLLYKDLFEEYDLSLCSAECWSATPLAVGAAPCTAYSILADEGYLIGCEGDMYCTITMGLLSCAALGESVPFMGEFTVKHPENRDVELLWHCGQFAYSLKKEGSHCSQLNQRQCFEVKEGNYTLCRMDEDRGRFTILPGTFKSAQGPYTTGTYIWAEFEDLRKWERKVMEGPYIHHFAEIEGDYTEVIAEFCKYVPNLHLDSVEK
ncbi:MAG: hypothetical protein MR406_07025 [Blautia sp.]|nr:hypothetical protein [Blautia sp.]